ncbi:hypothetical protein Geob_1690 [Geotalea daltonii FRC-32]|uniref:Uncharacterized protein n=1 Tax=Geotalea daltonii (strain DSM 22248 / JCM 15807 / FRC-32) TaxID=316067 RepID=B9M6I8_GEODF|nr:PQ-loop repeat-containing protein [Geotalea daltonii]ACM20048.1 hypothetical protein Geob_1690 [Geotalea daltonii FRC-32]
MIRSLYALNGIVAVLLYLPQIRTILRNKEEVGSFSLITFGGWSVGSIITALYAWTLIGDPMFAAVSLANMLGSGTVFTLVAGRRLKNRHLPALTTRHETDDADSLAENFG